jgi:hypothetical protein
MLVNLENIQFDGLFMTGLCPVIVKLRLRGILNPNEWQSLIKEIEHFGSTNEFFLGEKGDAKPRKEFIQKRIKAHGGFRQ